MADDPDEFDRFVELMHAIGRADHPNYLETRGELAEFLTHSYVDLEQDSLVAVDSATGRFLGLGIVEEPPIQETLVREILQGGIHPDVRGAGLGRVLLAWQEARGIQRLSRSHKSLPGWLVTNADERAPSAGRLLERSGFAAVRYFVCEERDLTEPIALVDAPAGIRLLTFDPRFSDSALTAYREAFRDHWGSQPASAEQWESLIGRPDFRPDLSFLAVDEDDRVIGLLITRVTESDWPLQGFSSGYIELVGVVRDWRRRGVAPALLAASFAAYRDVGLERSVLDVDSENPTGAAGLYNGMGFRESSRSVSYVKVY
jgi:mycothiol synthase